MTQIRKTLETVPIRAIYLCSFPAGTKLVIITETNPEIKPTEVIIDISRAEAPKYFFATMAKKLQKSAVCIPLQVFPKQSLRKFSLAFFGTSDKNLFNNFNFSPYFYFNS